MCWPNVTHFPTHGHEALKVTCQALIGFLIKSSKRTEAIPVQMMLVPFWRISLFLYSFDPKSWYHPVKITLFPTSPPETEKLMRMLDSETEDAASGTGFLRNTPLLSFLSGYLFQLCGLFTASTSTVALLCCLYLKLLSSVTALVGCDKTAKSGCERRACWPVTQIWRSRRWPLNLHRGRAILHTNLSICIQRISLWRTLSRF